LKVKKVPMRKCVACGENKAKKELIRIVKNNENYVDVDLTGKMNGRGAYICSNSNCLEKAIKKKQLSRALDIDIPDEVFEKLDKIIHSNQEQ
jgi:hypothetical protein